MEVVVELLRKAARLWYTETQVILIDLLAQTQMYPDMTIVRVRTLTRGARVSEEEMVFKMKMNVQDVRKAMGRLRLDKFVKVETKIELKRQDTRQIHRMFYYVDFKTVYDTIKFKIWKIQKHYRDQSQTERNERNYKCPRCNQTFTQLEATAFMHGPSQLFRCPYHRPDEAYFLELEEAQESESHVKLTRFMQVIEPIVQLLKRAETVKIPQFTPSTAVAAMPDTRPQFDAQGKPMRVTGSKTTSDGGVRYLGDPDKEALEEDGTNAVTVEIQDTHALSERQRAAEEAEKERKRRQNALPFWHNQSTISAPATTNIDSPIKVPLSEQLNAEAKPAAPTAASSDLMAEDVENADIMDYYESYYATYAEGGGDDVAAESEQGKKRRLVEELLEGEKDGHEAKKAKRVQGDEEEDDDDEDEFIDVNL